MPRPSTTFTWATNTNYTGGPAVGTPTKVLPSGADIAEGYEPAQEPGAQGFNYNLNLVGQWITWLAAGVLDGTWEFTGASVKVDGTLEVVGAMTFDSDVTLAANKSVIVSGTGNYKRGSKIRHVSAMGGTAGGSSSFQTASDGFGDTVFNGLWKGTATGDLLAIPIMYNEGERITQIQAVVRGDSTAQVKMTLYRSSDPSSGGSRITGATCAVGNTDHTITLSSLTEVGGAGTFYYLVFLVVGAVASQVATNGADITIDVP